MSTIIKLESLKLEAQCIYGGNHCDWRPLYFMIYMQALDWIGDGAFIWEMASEKNCNG